MANGDAAAMIPGEIPRPSGLVLAPFRALRYDPDRVALGAVLAPPYDVIDEREHAELEARDPYNVVRLTLPRDDGGAEAGYAKAAAALADWREAGALRADPEPALYVYEEQTADHVQRGLVGALGLSPAEDGIVLPHENTMAGPVADRLGLMSAVEADLEPIFLVYDGGGAASRVVAEADRAEPQVEVETPDGVVHRLWAITDPAVLAEVATDLAGRRAVIADGHHRYATFLAYQAGRHSAGDGPGPWDLGLALLVDGSAFGPKVHPIHRVVPGLAAAEAAERAAGSWLTREVTGTVDDALAELAKAGVDGPAFAITDGDRHWLLTEPAPAELAAALPADRSAAWRSLDVTIAHLLLIRRTWGLEDREGVVDYAHDVDAALSAARATGGTALLLNPTPVAGVAAVAAAGDRMPRKSTLFVPKPATGLLIRVFADQT
ncbi:MAG: hypothetical protein QOC82_619 [Frankiaceae bacterium]|jgi:uncharacterized protein (DUF1015 family)|nr:hypothetical protein [Frankiaceae bacterium]